MGIQNIIFPQTAGLSESPTKKNSLIIMLPFGFSGILPPTIFFMKRLINFRMIYNLLCTFASKNNRNITVKLVGCRQFMF